MSKRRLFVTDSSEWDLEDRFWPEEEGMPFVFIKRIMLPDSLPEGFELFKGARLYLFGRRVPVESLGGYTIHFYVLELRTTSTAPIIHHVSHDWAAHEGKQEFTGPMEFSLALSRTVNAHVGVFDVPFEYEQPLFAAFERAGMPQPASRWLKPIVRKDFSSAKHRPRWVEGNEGHWPLLGARPMLFVSQIFLRENGVTREYLTWDTMFYLFMGCYGDRSEVKIYQQDTDVQTAEDHYQTEELIGEYLNNPNNADVIKKCVEHRDKYLHQFLLEQENLSAEDLKLLAAKSYNKSIRAEAAKRLKGM